MALAAITFCVPGLSQTLSSFFIYLHELIEALHQPCKVPALADEELSFRGKR